MSHSLEATDRFGTTSPLNLAVVRIAVFFLNALFAPAFVWFNNVPRELLDPPFAWGAAVAPFLPIGPVVGAVVGTLFQLSALLAMVGLATRWSSAVCAVLGIWVLGLPQLFGKIDHHHHLLWFAAILAVSPCGEALSIDSLRRRRKGLPRPAAVSALPLRTIWLLIGIIYFFPGYWKLQVFREWVFGDHVKLLLWAKWAELGDSFRPLFRIDRYPSLYRSAGLLTILFELSFVFLLFHRRTRPLAVLGGIAFHVCTLLLMGINFTPLLLVYVAFVDWNAVASRLGRRRDPAAAAGRVRPGIAAAAVCGILVAGNVICGLALIDSWPFAVYPTFAYDPSPVWVTTRIDFLGRDGKRLAIDSRPVLERFTTARWSRLMRRITDAPPELRETLTRAVIVLFERNGIDLGRVAAIRVYREEGSVAPDHRNDPGRRHLILELTRP